MHAVSREQKHGFETLVLEDPASDSRVELVPARGAICTRFRARGVEMLYLDEETLRDSTRNVRGGIPVLFPISGRLPGDRYLSQGKTFSLGQHGFARALGFSVEREEAAESSAEVTLTLRDSESTRQSFPYSFALRLTFRLAGPSLTVTSRIENRGAQPMPHQLGFHPYFFVPVAAKEAARIDSRAEVAFDNRTRRTDAYVPPDFSSGEVDLHLLDHRERETKLHRGDALPPVVLEMSEAFRCLVLWTLQGKDFVCVEPWVSGAGALASGQGLRWVKPSGTDELSFTVR